MKTVKLNLRTFINPNDPSLNRAHLTASSPRSTNSDRVQPQKVRMEQGHPEPIQEQQNPPPTTKQRIENALLSILEEPEHDSNAFMEVLMRKHENSLRLVAAETHSNHSITILDLKAKNEALQRERDELAVENEKLKMAKDVMGQELSEVRDALLKSRLECKRLEQTVSDLEELVKQQEEIHILEIEQLRKGTKNKLTLDKSSSLSTPLRKNESKPEIVDLSANTKFTGRTKSSISERPKSRTIPTTSVDLYLSREDKPNDLIEENRRSTITTTILTSQPLRHSLNHQIIEERLAQALQAQAEVEEKLLKREQALRDLSEKNRLLQQQLRKIR